MLHKNMPFFVDFFKKITFIFHYNIMLFTFEAKLNMDSDFIQHFWKSTSSVFTHVDELTLYGV